MCSNKFNGHLPLRCLFYYMVFLFVFIQLRPGESYKRFFDSLMIENFEANSQRAHFTHSGDKRKLHRGTSEIGSKTDFTKIEHYV